VGETKFHTHAKQHEKKNMVLYTVIYGFRDETGKRKTLDRMIATTPQI
jgi:hypothetical protein